MQQNKIILLIAMLCAAVQGAWAQANWESVYAMTQTTSADWTALNASSTTGRTLGSEGNTTYYYVNGNPSFTNTNGGGSGLTIQGTVYLYTPSGVTLTCTGANASGATGAGAGIELAAGNTLYLLGGGTVTATGGNAANGGNGAGGTSATGYDGDWTATGTGGNGGYGGGGAGAGIGTKGGDGGNGGSGGSGYRYDDWKAHNGTNGSSGTAGSTAGAMGNLYVVTSFVNLSVTGGNAGSNGGSGGNRGRGYAWDGYSYNYTVAGGGGGGGGGFGGAASNIGTGGPGGGGGGGGAGGAQDYRSNSTGGVYDVTAYGGKGGKNANGSNAADGTEAPTTGTAYDKGWVTVENGSFSSSDWNSPSGDCSFGSGGAGGSKGGDTSAGRIRKALTTDENGNYLIYNATDWDALSEMVEEDNSFNGKFVKLTTDISVSTMVGTSSHSFSGTFDGQGHKLTFTQGTVSAPYSVYYCAPFCYTNGATIQNLKVTGNIYTRARYGAGLVAFCGGTTNITNCHVSTVIHSSCYDIPGLHGGFVAWQAGLLNITGCVFTGRLLTTCNTDFCAGFVGFYNGNVTVISNSLYAPDANISLAQDEKFIIEGFTFVNNTNDGSNCYYTETMGSKQGKLARTTATAPANLGSSVQDYGTVKAYENGILFDGKYYVAPATISLANAADNSTTISDANGYFADVTLSGRTLYKDGAWNTLCLPFDVTLAGSPLAGAVARPLTEAHITGTTLNLEFGSAVSTLQAGTPYIIMWESGENLTETDLVFNGVTIDKTDRSYDNGVSDDTRVRFLGTYDYTEFNAEDKSILLMGGGNTLYYPQNGASIGAFRAYFKIGEDDATGARLTAFNIDFGGDNTTGILEVKGVNNDGWYTMDGRRLSQKPSRPGVYINNGVKVVVK